MARLAFALGIGVLLGACASSSDPDGPPGPASLGMPDTTGDDGGGTGGETDDGVAGPSTGSGGACTPGMQIACACPGDEMGVQACAPDGSGYLPCECPSGGSTGPASDDTSGGGDQGTGNADCDQGDCASCQVCTFSGPCAMEADACLSDPGCVALNECIGGCMDAECQRQCQADVSRDTLALFESILQCVVAECPVTCGGP